jgi:hypothetical protein
VQNPETVSRYFKEGEILGFIRNNIEAHTHDKQLAGAIANDLVRPFVDEGGRKTRIRTGQQYSVCLTYHHDHGTKKEEAVDWWSVIENLRFQERLPFDMKAGSNLAVFVFCDSELPKWLSNDECMYRSIAYIPQEVAARDEVARVKWVTEHLDVSVWVSDCQLTLEQFSDMSGPDRSNWVVRYVVGQGDAAKFGEMRAASEKYAEERGDVASLRVVLRGKTTQSLRRTMYTAYLAYPTYDPQIDFRIDGPAEGVDCNSFYSRGLLLPGATSPGDVSVRKCDGAEESKHLEVSLAQPRWVFPMSGVSFGWTFCGADGARVTPDA